MYCSQCACGNERLKFFAFELIPFTDLYLKQMENVDVGFDYSEFHKGSNAFSNWRCNCLDNDDCHVGNKECAKEKKLKSCLECAEFFTCDTTEYQKKQYPFEVDSFRKVERGIRSMSGRGREEGKSRCRHVRTLKKMKV